MAKEQCVLIKQSELDALRDPLKRAKDEYDKLLKQKDDYYQEELKILRDQINTLKIPIIDPLVLKVDVFVTYRRKADINPRGYLSANTDYDFIRSYKTSQNFQLDLPLSIQINRIIQNVSENIQKDCEERFQCSTEEYKIRVLREIANMDRSNRKKLLKPYKWKK